jgi:hypothetical protein
MESGVFKVVQWNHKDCFLQSVTDSEHFCFLSRQELPSDAVAILDRREEGREVEITDEGAITMLPTSQELEAERIRILKALLRDRIAVLKKQNDQRQEAAAQKEREQRAAAEKEDRERRTIAEREEYERRIAIERKEQERRTSAEKKERERLMSLRRSQIVRSITALEVAGEENLPLYAMNKLTLLRRELRSLSQGA